MEKNGWIKLHRKMLDNPIIMKDADHLAVWTYLLLNATHSEYPVLFKGKRIMLQQGQIITGCVSIGEKLSITESKVRRILNNFESDGQIDRQKSNKNSLITILKWSLYQSFDTQSDGQVTDNRRTSDGQVTTNNNDKNIKNVNNEIYIYSDDTKLNNSILEFIAYRKSIKKPMTENAVKLMLGKLNKMSSDLNEQIDILNQSIVNGWAGIFPLPVEKRQQKKNSFNNYPQRTYDFDDLEKQLLANK